MCSPAKLVTPSATRKCCSEDACRTAAICSRSGSLFGRADNCGPDDPRVWYWLAPDAAAGVVAVVVVAPRSPASRLSASDAAAGVAATRVALPPRLTAPQDAAAVVVAALSSPPTGRLDAAAEMLVSPLHLTVRWVKCRSVHYRCRPDAAEEEVAAA
jgi:hypothetical protein